VVLGLKGKIRKGRASGITVAGAFAQEKTGEAGEDRWKGTDRQRIWGVLPGEVTECAGCELLSHGAAITQDLEVGVKVRV